jgi:hypothetical protein
MQKNIQLPQNNSQGGSNGGGGGTIASAPPSANLQKQAKYLKSQQKF